MMHIVFNEPDITVLEKVIGLDETLQGKIVQIKDDYAVGPLQNIYEQEGIENRKNWWLQVLEGGDFASKLESNEVDDEKTFREITNALEENEEEQIWIWCAQNKHDVSGYYWLMSRLKEWQGRVHILYLNNLPFINEKGQIFYPEWISQIQPSEFLKAKKLARLITLSEFEIDPDEWTKICNQDSGIRLLEGGKKLELENINFYDTELKSFITTDFQKATKIINNYINKSKHTTGDAFLLWRLKEIIVIGNYETQGTIGKMKDFEVKKV
jgi:Domain of unknown function (DUF1835)/Protein of unknown function